MAMTLCPLTGCSWPREYTARIGCLGPDSSQLTEDCPLIDRQHILSMVKGYFSWLKAHEGQIISLGVILGALGGLHLYLVNQATSTANKLQQAAAESLGEAQRANDTLVENLDAQLAEVARLGSELTIYKTKSEELGISNESLQSRLDTALPRLASLETLFEDKVRQFDSLNERYTDAQEKSLERFFELQNAYAELEAIRYDLGVARNQLAAYQAALAGQVEDDYSERIDRLNAGLQKFTLVRWPISIESWDIEAAYLISKKEGAYGSELPYSLVSFEPYAYTLSEGFQCLARAEFCADICSLIDEAALSFLDQAGSAYSDAISKLATTEDGKSFDQAAIAEVAAIYRTIQGISDRTHLMLRGLSDGQTGPWSRSLVSEYVFDTLSYYSSDSGACSGSNLNCWRFDEDVSVSIPDPYSNSDLAGLRARYLGESIGNVLESCNSDYLTSDISYLEGVDDLRLSEASGTDVRTVVGVIIVGEKVGR